MDIMVQGEAKKFYKPNEVEIFIEFQVNDSSYENVLEKGTKSVEEFIKNIMEQLDISKEEMKTRNFRVFQNIKYDYREKRNIDLGFVYSQSAILKMDYKIDTISKFMEEVTKLENPPKYTMKFGIKEKEQAKREVMAEAYNKAKEKAEVISMAAQKSLEDCIKVDFRPFEDKTYSKSQLSDTDFVSRGAANPKSAVNSSPVQTAGDIIQNTFTPEDIEIKETLYCLWIAK